jgi:hypothetical protein
MQLMSTNRAHAFPYYQSVLLSSDLTELDEEILVAIGVYQPITARHIASQLALKHKISYSRKDINSRLFKTLSKYLVQDEYFRWSLRYEDTEYPGREEDPEKDNYSEDQDAVNLDSTTKVKYFNGKILKIKFTKINSSKSTGPQADIFYIYYKSPLALALLTKKVGNNCVFHGGFCEILEVD